MSAAALAPVVAAAAPVVIEAGKDFIKAANRPVIGFKKTVTRTRGGKTTVMETSAQVTAWQLLGAAVLGAFVVGAISVNVAGNTIATAITPPPIKQGQTGPEYVRDWWNKVSPVKIP